MTNEMIIFNERLKLFESGKIGGTGRMIEIQMDDGTVKAVEEPEEIHSYSRWRECGYNVRKGEKAIAGIEIWKYAEKKKEKDADEDEGGERIFKKKAVFFKFSQVEPIREEKHVR